MTQAVIGPAAVAAAVANPVVINPSQPVQPAGLTDATEPSMEDLAALVPDPVVEPLVEVEGDPTRPAPETEERPAEATAAAKPEATDVDAALERATKAAAKAREGSRRYAETQRMLQQQREEVQRVAREAEQVRQENLAARKREEAFKQDPYKALKDAGMTDQQLAERAIRENTPEALTQKLADELKVEREKREALETRLASEQAKAKAEAQRAATQAEYTQLADNEAMFPELSRLTSKAQLNWAVIAIQTIESNGYPTKDLTPSQVAEAAEKMLIASRKPGKATTAAPVTPAAKPAAKPSGVTLTNKQAQTRTVAPANWDDLSDEQQMAHIASALPDPT